MEDFHSSLDSWELINHFKSVLVWLNMKLHINAVQYRTHPNLMKDDTRLLVDLSMNCGRSTTHGAVSLSVGQTARRNYLTHMEILRNTRELPSVKQGRQTQSDEAL